MTSVSAQILKDLAPTGRLRAAINFGNPVLAQQHPQTGEPQGVSVRLAHELARRLNVDLQTVTFDAAGKVVEALKNGAWDVAFLAIDPVRAAEIAFTAPYVIIEGTYLVRQDSPLQSVNDVDRDGIRIAVGRGAAYDLFLTRALKHAEVIRAATSAAAVEAFVEQGLEAAAGVRQPLQKFAAAQEGYRVMNDRFTSIQQAMGTPRGRDAGLAFLKSFVEDMKRSGFVERELNASGQTDATVAPLAS